MRGESAVSTRPGLLPLMLVGTGSDVGKSVLCAAFGRIFLEDGYRPAPFKAQNMSLNSHVTPDGLEIGRAQAVQAEACQVVAEAAMNPVLLKPSSDTSCQVVLHGRPLGTQSAREYFDGSLTDRLFPQVITAFQTLASRYNPVILEGAGSISEVNLWDRDIVNLPMAEAAGAVVYLVGDIDRGGVIGSIHGSLDLLPARWRALVKGIIINKFRGDPTLFADGVAFLEQKTGLPVRAVVPWFSDIHIEQEDALAAGALTLGPQAGSINVAVVLLPRMSNFTDFDTLSRLPGVRVYWARSPADLEAADLVFIPGSKNTLQDMEWLRRHTMDQAILRQHRLGKGVYGICGGYQIMGRSISDPQGVESALGTVAGLGILPVDTVMETDKHTRRISFQFLDRSEVCEGYEIHMGQTARHRGQALCRLETGGETAEDGCWLDARTWGSYIHGILDNPVVLESILGQVRPGYRVEYCHRQFKETQYQKLAAHLRRALDMAAVYRDLAT